MSDWNKILMRQLKKTFGTTENIPEQLCAILTLVSQTYDQYEREHKMLERSIELSSAEMKQLNQLLRTENEAQNQLLLKKLSESLAILGQPEQEVPLASEQLRLMHVADTLRNETLKRKLAEEQRLIREKELTYANRIFRVISQINQMIVRISNAEDLFREACEIVVQFGAFRMAWISLSGMAEQSGMMGSAHGKIDDLPVLLQLTSQLRSRVMNEGSDTICDHLASEPALGLPERSLLTDLGYGSCMILPIRKSGLVIGTFNLFSTEPQFFNDTEIALLREATGDISFALDVLEKDKLRNLAEQKISLSEWRLRQAQAIAHLGSWSLEFRTGISVWSKEALKIYGIDPAESKQTYDSWLSYIHPDDLDHVRESSRKSRESQSRTAFYHRIIRKDGTIRHLYSQADMEFDDSGIPVGMYGVAHDITDIRETERALQASQADLKAIFDNTSEGFILTGLDYTVKAFNQKAAEIIQGNTGKVLAMGLDIRSFVHHSRKGHFTDAVEQIKAGQSMLYQYPFLRAGNTKWFDFTFSPVYQEGLVNGMIITATDITERKLAELRLIESEKRYSELFHLSPISQWVYDQAELKFLDVNQAALKHYGYTKKEFLAMTIKDIRPTEDLSLLDETILKNKSRKDAVFHQSFRHQKKNGEIIQVEIQSSNINFQGKNAKIIVAKDVTERFHYIQAIEHQNEKLKEISWMQSHIIRAPLARIMGLVSMIDTVADDRGEISRIFKYLRLSADELDRVIRDINDKSAIVQWEREP